MPRLRRSDCSKAGWARRRAGRGFVYLDEHGRRLRDEAALERVRALAIPPAWRDVWICRDELGHLQATGIDDAGRKQYLYHDLWRTRRDREKFESMLDFGRRLPALRRRVARDIRGSELDRRRVLALAARLLDLGLFRVGSDGYGEENGSHGLATVTRSQVTIDGGVATFDYPAKSGQRRIHSISDPAAVRVIEQLRRRRGGERLLAFREGRRWTELRSDDVNEYVKEGVGEDFSAKAFRTWNATVLAALLFAERAARKPPSQRAVSAVAREVAEVLGNTPAVTRASYIDPRIVDKYLAGNTIDLSRAGGASPELLLRPGGRMRERIEAAVIELLE
ncbi:MAG: DNA topoisomerase IB [Solirubrobacteraceae bacterium]